MSTPPAIHAITTGHGPKSVSSILWLNAAPRIAAGRKVPEQPGDGENGAELDGDGVGVDGVETGTASLVR